MTKTEAMKIVATMFGSYPNSRFNEQNFESYIEGIQDLDADVCGRAVQRLIRTSKFLPSLSEIRESATASATGARKTGAEAYGELLYAVRRHGAYPEVSWVQNEMRTQSPWPPLTPDVLEAMRRTWGTWADCCSASDAQEMSDRARFIEAYDGESKRAREDAVSGMPLPRPPSATDALPRPRRDPTPTLPKPSTGIVATRPTPPPDDPSRRRRWTAEELEAELEKKKGRENE